MTIQREINGETVTITLTTEELLNAYYEQSATFHHEDLDSVFDSMVQNKELTEEQIKYLEQNLGDVFIAYEDNLRNDEYWYQHCENAIREVWFEHWYEMTHKEA